MYVSKLKPLRHNRIGPFGEGKLPAAQKHTQERMMSHDQFRAGQPSHDVIRYSAYLVRHQSVREPVVVE